MTNPIQIPNLTPGVNPVTGKTSSPQVQPGQDFKSILLNSLEEVNKLQTEADQGVQKLLTGETENVAEVLAAVNKAGIAFDLLMEVRNKLTESYREIQQIDRKSVV